VANSANTITVTDDNFETAIQGAPGLAMLDFGAEWCGPCRIIAPIVDQLADEYAGRVTVGKIDADTNLRTVARYGVRSLPSVLLFKNGQVVDTIVGAVPKPMLRAKVEEHLA
jgi:thioredoxin 1